MAKSIRYDHPFKVRHDDIVEARAQAHAAFDRLHREGFMTRTQAYAWLASTMHLPREEAHIGRFHHEQCARVVQLATAWLKRLRKAEGQ